MIKEAMPKLKLMYHFTCTCGHEWETHYSMSTCSDCAYRWYPCPNCTREIKVHLDSVFTKLSEEGEDHHAVEII